MRVENIKGAVWTVDEIEFYKRRPQRLQERIGYVSVCKVVTVYVVCHSSTVNNTTFFPLFPSSHILSRCHSFFSNFLCWLLTGPAFMFAHNSFLVPLALNSFLHRMQFAPTCPSISVLCDMRMTLARSGW